MYDTISKKKKVQVSIRELVRKPVFFTNFARKGQDFIITKHGKPMFEVIPIKKHPANILKDFQHLMFHSGDKNLSKKIDKIVYGK